MVHHDQDHDDQDQGDSDQSDSGQDDDQNHYNYNQDQDDSDQSNGDQNDDENHYNCTFKMHVDDSKPTQNLHLTFCWGRCKIGQDEFSILPSPGFRCQLP